MSLTLSIIALVMSVISLVMAMWQFIPLIKRYMMRRKIMRYTKHAKSPRIRRMLNSVYGINSDFSVIDEFLAASEEKRRT